MPYGIIPQIRKPPKAIKQAKGMEHRSVNSHADPMVSGLNPGKAFASGKRSISHDLHRETPTFPCVSDVLPKLA